MLRFLIALLLFPLMILGCVHYPRSLDNSYYAEIKKTPYSASLNFYQKESYRIDQSNKAKTISNELQKSGIFTSQNSLYDDYVTPNNLIVDCSLDAKERTIFGNTDARENVFAFFIPFPIKTDTKLQCSLTDKSGIKKSYSSNIVHSTYYFILFAPVGIAQYFIYPLNYPEQILTQDILKQINTDQSLESSFRPSM